MPAKDVMYSVRFGPMGYGKDNDGKLIMRDRGEVITLIGAVNDEQLTRLGYITEYSGETFECAECGARFISQRHRTTHGDRRHREDLTDAERDNLLERDLAIAAQQAPLYLDKTLAAQKA